MPRDRSRHAVDDRDSTGTPRRCAASTTSTEFTRIGQEADRHHRLPLVERSKFRLERSAVAAEQRDVAPEHPAKIDERNGPARGSCGSRRRVCPCAFSQDARKPLRFRRCIGRFEPPRDWPPSSLSNSAKIVSGPCASTSASALPRKANLPERSLFSNGLRSAPNRQSPDAARAVRRSSASPRSAASTRMETSATSSG